MTPETPTSSAQETTLIDAVAARAAEESRTAEEFQRAFDQRIQAIVGTDGAEALPPELAMQFETRKQLIAWALKDVEKAQLADHEPGVGGTNVIGGGAESMTLSRERVAAVKDERSAEEVAMIAAHEGAHGEAVPLRGELLPAFAGQTRKETHLLLQEGFAEVKANEAMGRSVDAHREGQPQEVYGEGQDLILHLIRRTSRQEVELLMTEHGDLEKFQRESALAA